MWFMSDRNKNKQTNKQTKQQYGQIWFYPSGILIVLKWVLHIRMEPDLKEFSSELRWTENHAQYDQERVLKM